MPLAIGLGGEGVGAEGEGAPVGQGGVGGPGALVKFYVGPGRW